MKNQPTPEQWKAIRSKAGYTLVVAPPGSGKTFTLAHRVKHIRKQRTAARNILVLTFSYKAACEMDSAIAKLCLGLQLPWLGTSHAICCRILEAEGIGFTICDEHQQRALVDSIVGNMQGIEADDAIQYITWLKTQSPTSSSASISAAGSSRWPEEQLPLLRDVYKQYQERLRAAGLKDFTDLLRDTVKLFEQKPKVLRRYQNQFKHIIADELQDFTPLQFRLLELLKSKDNVFWGVGDDDQIIYSWLGADPQQIINIWKTKGIRKVRLTKNFRSQRLIVEAAEALIVHNQTRIPKKQTAKRRGGSRIMIRPAKSAADQAESIVKMITANRQRGYKLSDIVVLGRKRICFRHVQRVLEDKCIPCVADNAHNPYATKDALALINYLKAIANSDDSALEAIINYPSRWIGDITVKAIKKAAKRHQCSYVKAMGILVKDGTANVSLTGFQHEFKGWRRLVKTSPASSVANAVIEYTGFDRGELKPLLALIGKYPKVKAFLRDFRPYSHRFAHAPKQNAVQLMTIHKAKGTEFKAVFLVGMEHGVLPDERQLHVRAGLEEERRLAYVAITRAKNRLYIYYQKDSLHFTRRKESYPSRFLSEIPNKYTKILRSDERLSIPVEDRDDSSIDDFECGETVYSKKYGDGQIKKLMAPFALVDFNKYGVKKVSLDTLHKTRTRPG